jgi:hypothetical protein
MVRLIKQYQHSISSSSSSKLKKKKQNKQTNKKKNKEIKSRVTNDLSGTQNENGLLTSPVMKSECNVKRINGSLSILG